MNDQSGPLNEIINKLLNEYVSQKDESIKNQKNKNEAQRRIIEKVYEEHPDWEKMISAKVEEYKKQAKGKKRNEQKNISNKLSAELYVEIPGLDKIVDKNGLRNPLNWDWKEWNDNSTDESKIITELKKIRKDENFKDTIKALCTLGKEYKIDIGFGHGLWADIPYIAVMDKAETTSTQEGIYVIYLMKKDGSSMYLTLNQGAKGKNLKSQANEISGIISKSDKFKNIVEERKFKYSNKDEISLSDDKNELSQTTKKYIKATILYKEYKKGQVPSEAELEEDLKRMMEIYEYVLSSYSPNSNSVDGKMVKAVFDESKNRIFYGPPGTGKTKKALETAYKLIGSNGDKSKQIKLIQFHPGYHYSDFVEALDINGKCAPRIFKEFANEARKEPEKNYVLIIDEINRANVSEVFGELLYGLEYRNVEFSTEMSKESFSVPDNLYVIGTMNTADRSLQNMDYAVRRRFSFEHIKAEAPQDKTMKSIFDKVHKDIVQSVARGVDPEDIMPGISYFTVDKDDDDKLYKEHLEYKIKYEIIPLLKEYAKDGMLTKMVKLEDDKSLAELLKNSGADYSDILIEMALDSEAENNKGADK